LLTIPKIDLFFVCLIFILTINPVISRCSISEKNIRGNHVELTISDRFEELFGKEKIDSLIRDFSLQNPDLRIAMSKTDSDIYLLDEGEYKVTVFKLASLNQYFHAEDEQLAINLVSFMDLLFYNIDLLKEAGFDRPPKTRDDLLSYVKAISQRNGVTAFALSLNQDDNQAVTRDIFSWIWAAGNDFWPSDTEKPLFMTKAIVNDLTYLGKLQKEGLLTENILTMTARQRLDDFAAGNIAMMIASTKDIAYIRDKMGDDAFGITLVPGSSGKYRLGLHGIYAGIHSECESMDEAWKFLLFLAERSTSLAAELKAVPGNSANLAISNYMKDDPFYSKAWQMFEFADTAQGFSFSINAKEYENIVSEEIYRFFSAERTADETAANIQKRWDALYSEDL
jgi:ABC-type glycerol-3-phosphate transport system substrate-binding protein